jgi:hypothetical protein
MIKYHFSFALLLVVLSSCAPVYTPNLVNSPLFSQQNDARLQGSVGLSGYDVQAAYSPFNNIGIMANTSFSDNNSKNYYSRFYEGAAGYYLTFDDAGRFECYTGYGNAQTILNKTVDGENINAHYNRYFIQPGIGVKLDVFEGSFSTRIAYVDVYKINSNNPELRPAAALFVEPTLTGKIGYKYTKLFMQLGLSLHSSKLLSNYSIPVILNFGMNLSFSELYKKKEKTPEQ